MAAHTLGAKERKHSNGCNGKRLSVVMGREIERRTSPAGPRECGGVTQAGAANDGRSLLYYYSCIKFI